MATPPIPPPADLNNVNFVGFLIDCLIIRLAAVLHLLVAACAVTVLQLVSIVQHRSKLKRLF